MFSQFLTLLIRQMNILQLLGLSKFLKYRTMKKGGRLTLELNDHQFLFRPRSPDLSVLMAYKSGELNVLKHLLPENYNGIIIDAGGYIGTSAIALHDLFKKATVKVLEPSKANLDVLNANTNDIDNIEVIPGALVGSDQQIVKLFDRGQGEWGFTITKTEAQNPDALIVNDAKAYRISDLVNDVGEIGILKLDIEGGELDILNNDIDTLNVIPIIIAELHDDISPGTKEKFFQFSQNRILIKDNEEKYLSIKH